MNPRTAVKINRAVHGTRKWRENGTAERWVYLWDSKDYNKAKFVGRVDPKTMELVTKIGLWVSDLSPLGYEHWWKVDENVLIEEFMFTNDPH